MLRHHGIGIYVNKYAVIRVYIWRKNVFLPCIKNKNVNVTSLTAAAKLISGKKYSIAGPKFFKYKGEWLNDIRARMEQ